MIALTVISFVWAVAKQADTDGFAFYLLPTRAWELFAGSLLALGAIPAVRQRWLAEAICAVALAMIVWATITYDHNTIFPGVAALAPVLAAGALIHCAPGTWTGNLLSLPAPVAIGLISYSLYLWHWPLIVFWQYRLDGAMTGLHSAALIVVSLAIAWVSWRYIEQPFRDRARFPARRVWRWSGAGVGAVGAASLAIVMLGGWEARWDQRTLAFARAAHDYSPVRDECITSGIPDPTQSCVLGAEDAAPVTVVWGDSHAVEPGYWVSRMGRAANRWRNARAAPARLRSVMTRPRTATAPVSTAP